jgi:hypothetical protein
MSWIKDNKFVVALGCATLVGAVLLFLVASKGTSRYEQAAADFAAAAADVSRFERGPLYPNRENRDGKSKAIDEYRKSAELLQAAFESFRPEELKNVSPQDFTNHLKAVDQDLRKAFEESKTKLPDPFFCGFENYKTSLARGNATGILEYQLAAIQNLMLALAKSGASELKNLHRPPLPEEEGKDFKPQDTEVARPLPLEITFSGPEKSLRGFLSSLVQEEGRYVVIRSIRVSNSKKDPPRASDAQFEKTAPVKPAAADNVFGGGFVLPGEEPKVEAKKVPEGAVPAPEVAPLPLPPAAAPTGSGRVLSQVLGNEEVQVFLRLDLMCFLPVKKLP